MSATEPTSSASGATPYGTIPPASPLPQRRPVNLPALAHMRAAGEGVTRRTADMLSLDWTPTFTTELLRKDFDLGLAAARAEEVTMPLASSVLQLIQAAIGRGYRDKDFLSLFEVQAASSGMTLEPKAP